LRVMAFGKFHAKFCTHRQSYVFSQISFLKSWVDQVVIFEATIPISFK
jgi:hypothetical protein